MSAQPATHFVMSTGTLVRIPCTPAAAVKAGLRRSVRAA
jgi:hypothetical protein